MDANTALTIIRICCTVLMVGLVWFLVWFEFKYLPKHPELHGGAIKEDKSKDKDLFDFDDDLNVVTTDDIKLVLGEKYVDKVNALIDDIITHASTYYQILQLTKTEYQYINEAETEKMTKYIYATTMNSMTPAVISTIRTIYRVDTQKELEDFVMLRVKMFMINFRTNFNANVNNIDTTIVS